MKSLALSFLNESGQKVNMTINNAKEGLTTATIAAVMDTIIAKNIFFSKDGNLTGKSGAQIVERNVSKVTL